MDRAFFRQLSSIARAAIADAMASGLDVANKDQAGFDPVTEADRAAERAMRDAILARFPGHAVWGEEYGWSGEGGTTTWSLDPVDGTRALICGLPSWAVLAGVIENGSHLAGMIDLPALHETLIAVDAETWRGETPVRTSGCVRLAEARLSTTDPFLFARAEGEGFERVRRSARLTRYGLDAMAYARVATGDLDLVIESGLKRHDYDALIPVVRCAGGHIGDWTGGEDFASGRIVAAASRALYDEAVSVLDA